MLAQRYMYSMHGCLGSGLCGRRKQQDGGAGRWRLEGPVVGLDRVARDHQRGRCPLLPDRRCQRPGLEHCGRAQPAGLSS